MKPPNTDTPIARPDSSRATRVIGAPHTRVDGFAKVTGRATYAYEHVAPMPVAYGFIVPATIARGRVLAIDTAAAERDAGVLKVMTHRNAPPQAGFGPVEAPNRLARPRPELGDAIVRFHGQAVALVVATSLEAARAAAAQVVVRYQAEPAECDLDANLSKAYRPNTVGPGLAADTAVGDFDGAFTAAAVQVDLRFSCPYQHHNPMEPHAALAWWQGDALTIEASQQQLGNVHAALAATLQIEPDKLQIRSRFIGGGFGSKLPLNSELVLAALASKLLGGRPVKVAQTRQQMFATTAHRPACRQRVRLGADAEGRLQAIAHESWSQTSRFDQYAEQVATFSRALYAAPHRRSAHRLVALDLQHGESMRAPGEAPGMLAGESAMDELAHRLGIDPVELRLRNEAAADPETGLPFSSRRLVECLTVGARRFGWGDRSLQPRSRRDGRGWIGHGMAVGIRPNKIGNAAARVALRPDGRVVATLDMTDIGNGSYTILTQVAAEVLGVALSDIRVDLGDSRSPKTTGSGGSLGAGSSGSALYDACRALRAAIVQAAAADARSALYGARTEALVLRDGAVSDGRRSEPLAAIAARVAADGIVAEGRVAPGDAYTRYAQQSFAAYFAEVRVDADTGEVRVRRMLGVFDIGKVLNPVTARSQAIGGMAWGISAALFEEGVIDTRHGHVVNHDLAGYHFPTHADIPALEAVLLDGDDPNSNVLGSKGIGELGICGSGAAVANAIFNATGVRVCEFPITLDKIRSGMPVA